MADYPTGSGFTIDDRTEEMWVDERLISRARSGAVKARLLATAKKRQWKVVHKYLSTTDRDALETFYDANRAEVFDFTIFGNTYQVIFGDKDGLRFEPVSGVQWSIELTLLEV